MADQEDKFSVEATSILTKAIIAQKKDLTPDLGNSSIKGGKITSTICSEETTIGDVIRISV